MWRDGDNVSVYIYIYIYIHVESTFKYLWSCSELATHEPSNTPRCHPSSVVIRSTFLDLEEDCRERLENANRYRGES